MKKGTLSNLTVKRINSSPYFSPHFLKLEKETITGMTGAEVLPLDSQRPASILITNTHTDLSALGPDQLNLCELIIHPNSGYDNFSAEFISQNDFPVVIGNPIRAHAVANFILSALFSHYSPLPEDRSWNVSRKWPRKLLAELNVLILGMGHIGSLISSGLGPLVKNIHIYDPYLGRTELDFNNVDVLIPVCSLNEKNHHFINRERLLLLNEDFLLINAARGDLINTSDLLSVLKMRPDAYAFLDVFEKEPADFSEFYNIVQNISLSSHIAGVYKNIDTHTVNFEARVIFDFINLNKSEFEQNYRNTILKNRLHPDHFLI